MDLSDVFEYRDGKLFWLISPSRGVQAGSLAGGVGANKNAWLVRYANNIYTRARLVWALHHDGKFPAGDLWHVNGDPFDDRIENLTTKAVHLHDNRQDSNLPTARQCYLHPALAAYVTDSYQKSACETHDHNMRTACGGLLNV